MTVIAHTSDKTMKVTAIYGSTARGTRKSATANAAVTTVTATAANRGTVRTIRSLSPARLRMDLALMRTAGDYARGYAASGADYDGEGIFVRFRDERSACDVAGEQPVEVGDESFAESQPDQTADDGV